MTDTQQAETPDARPRQSRHNKTPWLIALVAVIAILVVGTAAAVTLRWSDRQPSTAAPAPSAWMQAACDDWMGAESGPTAPPSSWCASMWARMTARSPSGMMGSMMWGDPDQVRTACLTSAAGHADAQAWCNAMIAWMQNRASDYGGWGPWMMRPAP